MNYVSHWTWNVEYVDGVMEVSNFFTIILQKIIQKSLSSVVIAAKNFPPRIKRLGTWKNPILLSRVVILIGQSLFNLYFSNHDILDFYNWKLYVNIVFFIHTYIYCNKLHDFIE